MPRSLKNYETYIEKLIYYAQACEITVEYKDMAEDGKYIPSHRKIMLDNDLIESTEIATLIHELGHNLDDAMLNSKLFKKIEKAYPAFYDGKATEEQKELVLLCERNAWNLGRVIAKKLRIRLGKWYDEEEQSALKDYMETANEQT